MWHLAFTHALRRFASEKALLIERKIGFKLSIARALNKPTLAFRLEPCCKRHSQFVRRARVEVVDA